MPMFHGSGCPAGAGTVTGAPKVVPLTQFRTWTAVTWVTGPALAGLVLGWSGFTGLHATAAVCFGLAAVIAMVWLVEPTAAVRSQESAAPAPAVPLTVTLRLGAAFTCLLCATSLGVLTMPLFVTEVLHAEITDAGLVLGLTAALEIPLMVAFGVLAHRFGLRRLILIGSGLGVAYYAVATGATSVWQLAAAQVLNAGLIAAVQGLGITYFQNMLPGSPGRATTAFANSQRLAWMLAGPVLGLAQHFGYRVSFGACVLLGVLGAALLLTTQEPAVADAPASTEPVSAEPVGDQPAGDEQVAADLRRRATTAA